MNKLPTLWLALLALALSGCSTLGPPPAADATAKATYEASRTLPNAVAVAESLRDAYAARSADLRREERFNGLALIGLGMIGGDLVARGLSPSTTLGLGLGGVGLYTANNFVNPPSERLVYAEAAVAVQCAINAVDPLRPAYAQLDTLKSRKTSLETQADALDDRLRAFDGNTETRVVRARNALAKARAADAAADVALGYLAAAGPSLVSVIGSMRVDVELQLVRGSPDYGALVASLIQQKVLPAAAPLTLPDDKARSSGEAGALVGPTARLEAQTAAVEQLVAMLNARPTSTDLQNCRVDPKATGITMKVEPAMLSVKAGDRGVLLASGGTPPYAVAVIADSTTAQQLTFSIATTGIVTVEAKADATPATYTAYVTDAAKGRETLTVTVTAAAVASVQRVGGAVTPTLVAPAAACATPDATVRQVQEGLRTLGITTVKVDGVDHDVAADGCQGKVTNAAMTQFYVAQGVGEGDVDKDPAKLLKQASVDVAAAVAKAKPAVK